MSGPGCTRIDLILVNAVALAAFESYEQIYGQGIAKHAMLAASFHLPSFGAKVTMPKTPSSIAHLERHELPEAIRQAFGLGRVRTRAVFPLFSYNQEYKRLPRGSWRRNVQGQ